MEFRNILQRPLGKAFSEVLTSDFRPQTSAFHSFSTVIHILFTFLLIEILLNQCKRFAVLAFKGKTAGEKLNFKKFGS